MPRGLTYKKAGVNIDEANKFVRDIQGLVKKTHRPGVLNNIGGFGGCFELKRGQYKNPVLVSSADGVGTKIKIAMLAGKHDTVGIDLVAMNVNDILAMGAQPLFFLDYIAVGKLSRKKMVDIVRGISKGCADAGCALIGGETAEMPAIYKKDEYDLAGFCVGVVDKRRIITGSGIRSKDVLLGLASSGLHSNGFSLVHKVFTSRQIKRNAKELLRPTKIYVKEVLSVLRHFDVRGIAHITGGAFYEKLMKIFPKGSSVVIKKGSWPVPAIFKTMQKKANIKESEMYRTFNMGIGMVLVTDREQAKKIQSHLCGFKLRSWIIGEVTRSKGRSNIKFTGED